MSKSQSHQKAASPNRYITNARSLHFFTLLHHFIFFTFNFFNFMTSLTCLNSASFWTTVASLISNPTFVSVLLAFIVAQAFLKLARERLWSITVPSTLSTLCCSITTSIAISHGVADPLFPLSLGYSLLVMSYSLRLRSYSDVHTKQMVIAFSVLGLVHGLDVGVGDTLPQLLAGAVLGSIVSMVYCLGSLFLYAMVLANIVSSSFSLYFRTAMPIFPLPWVMLMHDHPSPKIILATLASNPTFVSVMLVLIVVQSVKVFWKFLRKKELDFRMIYSCEGMPSTQSALCCAIITSVAIARGVVDSLFTLSLTFGFIVMSCAIRLRRFSELLKVVIRLFLVQMHQEDPDIDEEPNIEDLGDTIAQVLVGALLGCILAIWSFGQYY